MRKTSIRYMLEGKTLENFDAICKREGLSRAALSRQIVEQYVGREQQEIWPPHAMKKVTPSGEQRWGDLYDPYIEPTGPPVEHLPIDEMGVDNHLTRYIHTYLRELPVVVQQELVATMESVVGHCRRNAYRDPGATFVDDFVPWLANLIYKRMYAEFPLECPCGCGRKWTQWFPQQRPYPSGYLPEMDGTYYCDQRHLSTGGRGYYGEW